MLTIYLTKLYILLFPAQVLNHLIFVRPVTPAACSQVAPYPLNVLVGRLSVDFSANPRLWPGAVVPYEVEPSIDHR